MKLLSYRIWVLIFGIAVAAAIATVLLMSDGEKSISGKNISEKEGKTAGWFVVKKVKSLPQITADRMR